MRCIRVVRVIRLVLRVNVLNTFGLRVSKSNGAARGEKKRGKTVIFFIIFKSGRIAHKGSARCRDFRPRTVETLARCTPPARDDGESIRGPFADFVRLFFVSSLLLFFIFFIFYLFLFIFYF